TQEESFRPSQVVLLVDTSTSMQQPADDPSPAVNPQDAEVRWEAVRDLLADSDLIERLRESHVVDLAAFDSDLRSSQFRFPMLDAAARGGEGVSAAGPSAPDWTALLEPTGLSTRLGDSLDKLLTETRTETLAGVVVVSDGASNV